MTVFNSLWGELNGGTMIDGIFHCGSDAISGRSAVEITWWALWYLEMNGRGGCGFPFLTRHETYEMHPQRSVHTRALTIVTDTHLTNPATILPIHPTESTYVGISTYNPITNIISSIPVNFKRYPRDTV